MTEWIWNNIAGPFIAGTFAFVPLWVWVILAALALGWAWKTFGWQGLVAVAIAMLTLGAYRKGWKDSDSLKGGHGDEAEHGDGGPDFRPSPPKRRRFNPDIGRWE